MSALPVSHDPDLAAMPVGIFDSGLGGLSVLRAIRKLLPDETCLYVADSQYAPYGGRDCAYITERTLAVCEWLAGRGAKALVVACNTATTQAIASLRASLPLPVIGVEPGVKPATLHSRSRVVGVLATQATLGSARLQDLLARFGADCRFICQPGHGLVEAIERCDTDSAEVRALLRSYLEPMLEAGADTLVLGCTHYPFFDATLRELTQGRLELIDTGEAIARQLARVLEERGLRAPAATASAATHLYSTSDGAHLHRLASSLLKLDVPVESVTIPSSSPLAHGLN